MSEASTSIDVEEFAVDNNGAPITGGSYTELGDLGRRMRARRLMQFLSLRDLAELIGISRSLVSRLEQAPPSVTISVRTRARIEAWLEGVPGPAANTVCPHCGCGLEIALTAR